VCGLFNRCDVSNDFMLYQTIFVWSLKYTKL